ncbi:MAG: YdgA family protein [Betaproteobacteria bacterium]|jgi:uncharacterized protein YdgA (DUF945 family)
MKKILLILLAVALILILAYPTSAWYVGRQAEAIAGQPYRQVESMPYIKIIKREYKRGIFSAEETVTFELFGDLARFMEQSQQRNAAAIPDAVAPAAQPFKPLQVTVRSHVRHGPLPDGRQLAAAFVDSELEVDERFKPALAKVLGDRKLLTAHTVYGFDGEGESTFISPAFVTTLAQDGAAAPLQVSWEGIKARLSFTREMASYTMQGEAPKLDIAGGKGMHLMLTGMRLDAEGRRIFDDEPLLQAGRQRFTIAQASIDGPAMGDKSIVLKQISYDVNMPLDGEYLDIVAKIAVQDALMGDSNYGPAHYDFSMKRLHARTFAQLHRAMLNMYANPAATGAGSNPAPAFAGLSKPALKLLEYNPEVSLDRLSFRTAQGEVLVAARGKLIDIKAEDFQQPALLMAKLDASADIALPEGLLLTPPGMKADSEEAALMQLSTRQKQIDALVEQGYAVRAGAIVKTKLEFRNGQLIVNGKPFDPRALQAPAVAPVAPPARRDSRNQRRLPAR